jgi:hypothetical protein
MTKQLQVVEGFQVFSQGRLYGPGDTLEADEAEAESLIEQGLAKAITKPPRDKMRRRAPNKGRAK